MSDERFALRLAELAPGMAGRISHFAPVEDRRSMVNPWSGLESGYPRSRYMLKDLSDAPHYTDPEQMQAARAYAVQRNMMGGYGQPPLELGRPEFDDQWLAEYSRRVLNGLPTMPLSLLEVGGGIRGPGEPGDKAALERLMMEPGR